MDLILSWFNLFVFVNVELDILENNKFVMIFIWFKLFVIWLMRDFVKLKIFFVILVLFIRWLVNIKNGMVSNVKLLILFSICWVVKLIFVLLVRMRKVNVIKISEKFIGMFVNNNFN